MVQAGVKSARPEAWLVAASVKAKNINVPDLDLPQLSRTICESAMNIITKKQSEFAIFAGRVRRQVQTVGQNSCANPGFRAD